MRRADREAYEARAAQLRNRIAAIRIDHPETADDLRLDLRRIERALSQAEGGAE